MNLENKMLMCQKQKDAIDEYIIKVQDGIVIHEDWKRCYYCGKTRARECKDYLPINYDNKL